MMAFDQAYGWLLRTTVDVSLLVVAVLVAQILLAKWLTPRWSYALWCLVLVRLVIVDVPSLPGGGLAGGELGERVGGRWVGETTQIEAPASTNGPTTSVARRVKPRGTTPTTDTMREAVVPMVLPERPKDYEHTEPKSTTAEPVVLVTTTDPVGEGGVAPSVTPSGAEASSATSSTAGFGAIGFRPVVVGLWCLGALWLFGWTIVRELRFRRRLRSEQIVLDERVQAAVEAGCRAFGITRRVRVRITDCVASPAICGARRPVLLMPSALTRLDDIDLRNVVLHELAHVRAHDVWANWLLLVVNAVHWFNPLVWLAIRRARASREVLRDYEAVAAQPDVAPIRYARTFLELIAHASPRPEPSPIVGFLRGKQEVKRRILMIRSFDRRTRRGTGAIAVAVLIMLGWASLTSASRGASPVDPGSPRNAIDRPDVSVERQAPAPAWFERLDAMLDNHTVTVTLEETPVIEVLELLQAQLEDTNFVLTEELSQEPGDWIVDRVVAKDLTLRHLLGRVLGPLELEFSLYNGAILIGHRGDIPLRHDLRFYRVGSILRGEGDEYERHAESLIDIVRDVVGREEEWERDEAKIYFWRNLLCVTQTEGVHAELHRFLETIAARGSVERERPVWERATREALAKKIDIHFEHLSIRDTAQFLERIVGVPFAVSPEVDFEVHLRLKGVPVRGVLDWIETLHGVRANLRDGAVYFEEERPTEVRVYDLRDLTGLASDRHEGEESDDRRYELQDLIQNAVQPSAWEFDGAEMHFFGDLMVIVQTDDVHHQISTFLSSLRRALR